MSAVFVLVPILTAVPWSAVGAAVVGVAAAMGYGLSSGGRKGVVAVAAQAKEVVRGKATGPRAEVVVSNTQISADELAKAESFVFEQDGVKIQLRRNKEGACVVCAEAPGRSKAELEAVAKKVGQRLVQQLVYNKVVTELKTNDFQVEKEEVQEGDRIRIRVSRWV